MDATVSTGKKSKQEVSAQYTEGLEWAGWRAMYLRACMLWKLSFVFQLHARQGLLPIHGEASHTLDVIIGVNLCGIIVIVVPTSARPARKATAAILALQETLVWIDSGEVVTGIDSRGGVGNQMVTQVSKGALHDGQRCVDSSGDSREDKQTQFERPAV
jgi:hypothetical protein